MSQTERTAPGTASQGGSQISGDQTSDLVLTVAPPTDIPEYPARRPCRTRGCSGSRPLVPVGCAGYWDRCYRCTRRGLNGRPAHAGTAVTAVPDPWTERIVELLELAELAGAGWSA